MNESHKTELWRLAQAAFDQKRPASEDAATLDWLEEHPELADEMDQVLAVEVHLEWLGQAAHPTPFWSVPRLGILALAAAACLAVWLPTLWEQGPPVEPMGAVVQVDGPAPELPSAHPDSEPAGVASIISYEFEIESQRPRITEMESEPRMPDSDRSKPQVQIITFTPTRTRTAPRGANLTF